MLQNYIKTFLRNVARNKSFTIINLLGLSLGFTVFIILILYIQTELGYDKHNKKSDQIFRLVHDLTRKGERAPWAITTGKWTPLLKESYPEVKSFVRLIPTWGSNTLITFQNKRFYEKGFGWADPSLPAIFDLTFISGNPDLALANPNSIIVSEKIAKKYFGGSDPIGKTIRRDNTTDYTVSAVIKEIPSNSHFHFDFIASTTEFTDENLNQAWNYSYVLLKQGASIKELEKRARSLVDKHESQSEFLDLKFQPLEDIHLKSAMMYEFEPNGSISSVYIFSAIAVLILVIASINFINLATANSLRRIKEIGVRKALGAIKPELIRQHLLESTLLCFIAMLLSIATANEVVHFVNNLVGLHIESNIIQSINLIFFLAGTALSVGILAGAYPAFYISGLTPGKTTQRRDASFFHVHIRKTLVVVQFTISVVLISASLVMYKQLSFFQQKDLGIKQSEVLAIPIASADHIQNKYESFRGEALAVPGINHMARISNLPWELIQMWVGDVKRKGANIQDAVRCKWFTTDHDFVKTLGITLLNGRDFSREFIVDSTESVIINETAAKAFGLDDPIGQQIELVRNGRIMTIIGIAKDFHFAPLHNSIEPLLIFISSAAYGKLAINIEMENFDMTIEKLEKVWNRFEPDRPMEFFFLDSYFGQYFNNEKSAMNFVLMFSIVGVFIACLGLYGLSAFALELRLKEVGVRKVLGASVSNLFGLLTKEFLLLTLVSFILGLPISYFSLDRWLQGFAYRIDLGPEIFIYSGIIVIVISLATISYKSLLVARMNPTHILKSE